MKLVNYVDEIKASIEPNKRDGMDLLINNKYVCSIMPPKNNYDEEYTIIIIPSKTKVKVVREDFKDIDIIDKVIIAASQ